MSYINQIFRQGKTSQGQWECPGCGALLNDEQLESMTGAYCCKDCKQPTPNHLGHANVDEEADLQIYHETYKPIWAKH